jgi:hypothetical protein
MDGLGSASGMIRKFATFMDKGTGAALSMKDKFNPSKGS